MEDQVVFTQGNKRIVFMFGYRYVPQWYDELTQDWYEFTPDADTYQHFPTIDEALAFLGFDQPTGSTPVGTIIFKQSNYEETVKGSSGDVKLVECAEFGIIKLYRIEWIDNSYPLHSVQYTLPDAIKAYLEAIDMQKEDETGDQATDSSPIDDIETRLERQAIQHIEDRQHFDMWGNYVDSDTLYWS